MKELKVSAIREGTVIDHIPSDYTFKVVEILGLDELDSVLSIASNLDSNQIGKKGIIKVGGLSLKDEDVQKIAVFAPNATVSMIEDFKVKEKGKLQMPSELNNIVKCANRSCITNHEKVKTKFKVESEDNLVVRCHHCERCMTRDEMKLV